MKKIILIVIGVAIIVAVGLFVYGKVFAKNGSPLSSIANLGSSNKGLSGNHYYSFNGDYYYSIPDSYVVNDVAFPGVQVVIRKGEDLKVTTVDELYSKDVITVQPFKPTLTDKEAFQSYVNNNLKDQQSKNLKGDVTVTFGREDNVDTAILKVTDGGNPVRYQYIYNSDQPIVVVAKDKSESFDGVVRSLSPVRANKEISEDYPGIRSGIASMNTLFKTKMIDDLYRSSSKDLKAKISKDELRQSIDKATTALSANTSTFGAVGAGNEVSTSLLFTQTSQDGKTSTNAIGIMTIKKEDGAWKLAGLSLPSNDAFKSGVASPAPAPSPTPTPAAKK